MLAYLNRALTQRVQIASPFYPPLQILCHATYRLTPGMSWSPTETIFFATMKSFWPDILRRVSV